MSKKLPDKRIKLLAQKWLDGSSSKEEREEFMNWYKSRDNNLPVFVPEDFVQEEEEHERRILLAISEKLAKENKETPAYHMRRTRVWWAAAAMLCLLGLGYYFAFFRPSELATGSLVKTQINDIPPGGNKALLTLANGTKIILDSVHSGALASQGNSRIIKTGGNLLTYNSLAATSNRKNDRNSQPVIYNTLATPRGGQYQVVLADGTKVWLNAASSIRYPTDFAGKERLVEITGEAYFDVAKDVSHPFIVMVNGMRVEVLGTHFNVMAYNNEAAIQTTLIQGSVKVTETGKRFSHVLEPGEQAQIDNKSGSFKLIHHADVRLATAWKDGMLAFRNADIEAIMREVERWYDVDVVYEGKVSQRAFSGEIPRDVNLSELLRLFEVNKIHFNIDARKKRLTVLP